MLKVCLLLLLYISIHISISIFVVLHVCKILHFYFNPLQSLVLIIL